MIQDMNDNQDNNTAKVHGSGSMYVDAAIEALRQERKNNQNFSYMLITSDEKHFAREGTGREDDIIKAIAENMGKHPDFAKIMKRAIILYEFEQNPAKMLEAMLESFKREKQKDNKE